MDIIITEDKKDKVSQRFDSLVGDKRYCLVDIETTGLSRKYHKIVLIGLLYIEGDKKYIKQYFCNTLKEEKDLLVKFYEDVKDYEIIISYNGQSFDIPFINARFKENNLDYSLNPFNSFDLYRLIRKNKSILGLDRYNLKSIEEYLGIRREDTISGKESISLYYDFINNNNIASKDKVLLHNLDDLKYLVPVINILDHISENSIYEEYPKIIESKVFGDLLITSIKKNKDFLTIKGDAKHAEYHSFEGMVDMSIVDNNFTLRLPLINIEIDADLTISLLNTSIIDIEISSLDIETRNQYITAINKDIQYRNINTYLKQVFKMHFNTDTNEQLSYF